MAPRAWPSVTRKNVRTRPTPEAAGDLFQARVGATEAGRHREVDERVDGQGHDEHRPPEPLDPGAERRPAEAHHEVGDGEGDHDQDGPDVPAGQVGALDAPRRQRADDDAQDRHHHRQADGVPKQGGGKRPPDEPGDGGGPGPAGFEDQEGERRQQHGGYRRAHSQQGPGPGAPAGNDELVRLADGAAQLADGGHDRAIKCRGRERRLKAARLVVTGLWR